MQNRPKRAVQPNCILHIWDSHPRYCFALAKQQNRPDAGPLQIQFEQFGGKVFRAIPLTFSDRVWSTLATSIVLRAGEAFRFFKRRKTAGQANRQVEIQMR
jgi:hypothetical protein